MLLRISVMLMKHVQMVRVWRPSVETMIRYKELSSKLFHGILRKVCLRSLVHNFPLTPFIQIIGANASER